MKILIKIAIFSLILALFMSCEDNPYSEGMHWSYSIECENGFTYKILSDRRGVIPILNSDGTNLKCGEKKY